MIDYKLLKENNINPKCFRKVKSAIIVNNEYVLKENKGNNKVFSYLDARNFNYYPSNRVLSLKYVLYEYLKDYNISDDERAIELIDLVSLLHSKTTRYISVSIDDYKKIYEDIDNKINKLYSYYSDLNELIEQEIYMSPSYYLLVRNVSKVYSSLNYCKNELDNWYELVKESKKERVVLIHNNLSLDHLIRNENSYLISWDKKLYDNRYQENDKYNSTELKYNNKSVTIEDGFTTYKDNDEDTNDYDIYVISTDKYLYQVDKDNLKLERVSDKKIINSKYINNDKKMKIKDILNMKDIMK